MFFKKIKVQLHEPKVNRFNLNSSFLRFQLHLNARRIEIAGEKWLAAIGACPDQPFGGEGSRNICSGLRNLSRLTGLAGRQTKIDSYCSLRSILKSLSDPGPGQPIN
jgi:hypothetical protein